MIRAYALCQLGVVSWSNWVKLVTVHAGHGSTGSGLRPMDCHADELTPSGVARLTICEGAAESGDVELCLGDTEELLLPTALQGRRGWSRTATWPVPQKDREADQHGDRAIRRSIADPCR